MGACGDRCVYQTRLVLSRFGGYPGQDAGGLVRDLSQECGTGATLLLNVSPDRRGRFADNDVKALQGFRKLLNETFGHNLAAKAKVTADNVRGNAAEFSAMNLTDENPDTYWATDDGKTSGSFVISLKEPRLIRYVVLQEYTQLGQRVKAFNVEAWIDGAWKKAADGTTIGYKRILRIGPVTTSKIRVNITDAKACLVLAGAGVITPPGSRKWPVLAEIIPQVVVFAPCQILKQFASLYGQ